MEKGEGQAGSSGTNTWKGDDKFSEAYSRGGPRSWRGNRGGGRGFRRRGGDWGPRNKRWRGGGGPSELPFLHGGNINDPLNLESVKPEEEDEEEGLRPLEIIIPKNPRDPLNLKKIIKNRNKRQRRNSRVAADEVALETEGPSRQRGTSFSEDRPPFDPIVSPVPPAIVRKFNYMHSVQKKKSTETSENTEVKKGDETLTKQDETVDQALSVTSPVSSSAEQSVEPAVINEKKVKMNEKFRYGNFDRYYGCRIEHKGGKDPRLFAFKKEWFEKKSVLDIGCNAGYITLWIAKEFGPRRVLGIDIDEHLVGVARKNIRHYCDRSIQMHGSFPASFAHRYGPISAPPVSFSSKFPDNVWFRHENYVLECDEYLEAVKEEFDVILALSITKWIHLNWGDDGLKRFFKRIFLHLRPGGKLILEPQDFKSYYKRARMTAETSEVYRTIKFLPDFFQEYLLGEVGFESCENIDVPKAKTKGFDRPIKVYRKSLSHASQHQSEEPERKDKLSTASAKRGAGVSDEQELRSKRPKLTKFKDDDDD